VNIGIFGLGYVGVTTAACLAAEGHNILGVDPQQEKVKLINDGVSPIIEEQIGEMIEEQVAAGRLKATSDFKSVLDFSDLIIICVGTPSRKDGSLDNSFIRTVSEQIGEYLKNIKYCDNLFHAVKVTFANEVGQFCHLHNINSQNVMDIFCQDRKLNISDKYLKPGFAFGGSCLPKDLRAFLSIAKSNNITVPMLSNTLNSNRHQIQRALEIILQLNVDKIMMHGLAFKSGTDDLRESPYVELAEKLLGKGKDLSIHDDKVNMSRLIGENKSYIEEKLPHLSKLLDEDSPADMELIILCHAMSEDAVDGFVQAGKKILDLTGRYSNSDIKNIYCVV